MKVVLALLAAASASKVKAPPPPELDNLPPPRPVDGDVEHPAFEPYPIEEGEFTDVSLFEQFADGDIEAIWQRWRPSHALKNVETDELDDEDVEEWRYVGEWAIENATVFPGFSGDQGLVLKSEAAHHAISYQFAEPLDNTGKQLVVQYEVKTQQPLLCGGAYIKLFAATKDYREKEFSNDTPYVIMFGPDKCGATDKVHFILKRHGGEEHHLVRPPRTVSGLLTTLYTLIINPDQTFEIRINGQTSRAGTLGDDETFQPPLNPPREIDDESAVKPSDWVDDDYIPDPEETEKPADWDEDAPLKIPDPAAEMPEGWRVDLESIISDPDAEKPEDWDDEEDGEWVAPEVPNPECADLPGCGPWSAPLIRNPNYKGKWEQPMVPNPEYIGEWAPPKIPNPDYVEDATAADLDPIGGVGLELWTMQPEILFDNFYVGHSIKEAENLGNATWSPKFYIEQASQKAARKADEPAAAGSWKAEWELFRSSPLPYVAFHYNQFVDDLGALGVVSAAQLHPVAAGTFAAVLALLSVAVLSILSGIVAILTTTTSVPPQTDSNATEAERAAAKKTASVSKASGQESAGKASALKSDEGVRKR